MFDDDDDDDDAPLFDRTTMRLPNLCRKRGFSIYHREEEKKTIVVDDRYRQHTQQRESFLCVFLSFPLFDEVKKALLYNSQAL